MTLQDTRHALLQAELDEWLRADPDRRAVSFSGSRPYACQSGPGFYVSVAPSHVELARKLQLIP